MRQFLIFIFLIFKLIVVSYTVRLWQRKGRQRKRREFNLLATMAASAFSWFVELGSTRKPRFAGLSFIRIFVKIKDVNPERDN